MGEILIYGQLHVGHFDRYLSHLSISWALHCSLLLQGVQLKGELAGQSENDTLHTDELYRSSLNLVSSCRDTQVDMFHSQKMVMLTTIMFSDHFFFCMDHDSPQMDQICSLDDNLVRFGGKSECGAIKMWDNTFGQRSERYLVGLGPRKDLKWW